MARTLGRLGLRLGLAALAGRWVAARALAPRYPDVALAAGLELVSAPRRVLALAPHPLDLEWFAGGTCYLLRRAGGSVTAVVLTRGEHGGNRANMGQIREREQQQAAAILGYSQVVQLDLPDRGLTPDQVLPRVHTVCQQVQPDVILAFDPYGPLPALRHRDHSAVGAATLELVRSGLAQGTRVYLYATRQPNVAVDITEVIQEKEAAILAHRSQLYGPDAAARWAVRGWARLARGATPAYYTETFYRLV